MMVMAPLAAGASGEDSITASKVQGRGNGSNAVTAVGEGTGTTYMMQDQEGTESGCQSGTTTTTKTLTASAHGAASTSEAVAGDNMFTLKRASSSRKASLAPSSSSGGTTKRKTSASIAAARKRDKEKAAAAKLTVGAHVPEATEATFTTEGELLKKAESIREFSETRPGLGGNSAEKGVAAGGSHGNNTVSMGAQSERISASTRSASANIPGASSMLGAQSERFAGTSERRSSPTLELGDPPPTGNANAKEVSLKEPKRTGSRRRITGASSKSPRRGLGAELTELSGDSELRAQNVMDESAKTGNSSSLDASEKRKKRMMRDGSIGRKRQAAERRSSRRHLMDSSSRRHQATSKRSVMADASHQGQNQVVKDHTLLVGNGTSAKRLSDGSAVMDYSGRKSLGESSMEASESRHRMQDGSRKSRTTTIKSASSRKKDFMNDTSAVASGRRTGKVRRASSTRKLERGVSAKSRKPVLERATSLRSGGGRRPTAGNTFLVDADLAKGNLKTEAAEHQGDDLPAMTNVEVGTHQTADPPEVVTNVGLAEPTDGSVLGDENTSGNKANDGIEEKECGFGVTDENPTSQIASNAADATMGDGMENSQQFDALGFPKMSPVLASSNTEPGQHLPDFQVSDFSFDDLAFPFDSKTDIKFDDVKAAELSCKAEQKAARKETSSLNKQSADVHAQADDKQLEIASGHVVPKADIKTEPIPGIWVCDNCHEEHDEVELQFCGMCGTDRPKEATTTPPRKILRKPHSFDTANAKREKCIRRHQSQDGSATSKSASTRKSSSEHKPSSTGAQRKMRTRDNVNTTPRLRSKVRIRGQNRNAEVMMVTCLDADGEGEVVDMDVLNDQLNTFEPRTPNRSSKRLSLRRTQSDVAFRTPRRTPRAGRTPTAAAPPTPRSETKIPQPPLQRSRSFADAAPVTPGAFGPPLVRKPSIRKAIPRRAKSTTTDYLEQLQHDSNHENTGSGADNKGGLDDDKAPENSVGGLRVQSAHSGTGVPVGRPSLVGARASLMKSASQRFLGGLNALAMGQMPASLSGGLATTQKTVALAMGQMPASLSGGLATTQKTVANAIGGIPTISPFSRPRADAMLLDSDNDDDDNDEFANDSDMKIAENEVREDESERTGMLRDFSGNRGLADTSKSPRRRRSARNLMVAHQDTDGGTPKTPRRRRASLSARQGGTDNDGGGTRTPRVRRASVEIRARPGMDTSEAGGRGRARAIGNRMLRRGGELALGDGDSNPGGALDYGAIDIDVDEEDDNNDNPSNESLGYSAAATPRRPRERLAHRHTPRRLGGSVLVGKSDHGAVTPKGLNARSRIRRASLTSMQAIPNLEDEPSKVASSPALPEAAPHTPGSGTTLQARRRIRRASLGHMQMAADALPDLRPHDNPVPIKAPEGSESPADGHANARPAGRVGRARRRGSIEISNPMLQQALAHMPQDPTHAVRSDLQEEWKRQEQMQDMRKKAKEMKKRYTSSSMVVAAQAESEPLFEAAFDTGFGDQEQEGGNGGDDGGGADLELAGESQDVSDLSSHDE